MQHLIILMPQQKSGERETTFKEQNRIHEEIPADRLARSLETASGRDDLCVQCNVDNRNIGERTEMPLYILCNDITKMQVDAIVNAANVNLRMGGGVCGAIFHAAGAEELQAACDAFSPIQTGEAVITSGFALPAKYIIHVAGPVYHDGNQNEEALLRLCYTNALNLARLYDWESIAFPLISSGIYDYPKGEALAVATSAISDWLENHDMDVSLVLFNRADFPLSPELRGEVEAFIDEHYAEPVEEDTQLVLYSIAMPDDEFWPLDEPFSAVLLQLISAKGKTEIEVYKRANMSRKLFSKIRTQKGYTPGKKTVISLAVALELSLDETNDLLECAGFALSESILFDVIIKYFISCGKYDIYEINSVLFKYGQPILGG